MNKIEDINFVQLRMLIEQGFDEKFICTFFNIELKDFRLWKRKNPECKATLDDWQKNATKNVVKACYDNAIGYEFDVTKPFYNQKDNKVVAYKHKVKYAPNQNAIEFWLTNKDPENWKKRTENVQKVDMGASVKNSTLKARLELLLKAKLSDKTKDFFKDD